MAEGFCSQLEESVIGVILRRFLLHNKASEQLRESMFDGLETGCWIRLAASGAKSRITFQSPES